MTSSIPDAAHVLVGIFAHDPAQGFDEIGFPAAVRPDDAGETRLDQEIGRLAKALEAQKAQAFEFHCVRRPQKNGECKKLRSICCGKRAPAIERSRSSNEYRFNLRMHLIAPK